jgi:endoribonuclease LACTB2
MMESQTKIQIIANGVTRLELPARTLPPFTHINSYIVADENNASLVDPGFYEESSLTIVQKSLQGLRLESIVLTHTHPDHIEGIELVRKVYPDIPIHVHELERRKVEHHHNVLSLAMNEPFRVGKVQLQPVFTPGHSPGHVSFYEANSRTVLVGDMVAGFGSIWIGTPEGNINDYFQSLEKLKAFSATALAPGHGDVIYNVSEKLEEVKFHRLQRLEQVRIALQEKPLTLSELRKAIYPGIDPRMEKLAERGLLALLEKLERDEIVHYAANDFWEVRQSYKG